MRTVFPVLVIAFWAAGLAAAQGPSAQGTSTAVSAGVFREAETAVADVPSVLAPRVLVGVALKEQPFQPRHAHDVLVGVFTQLHQLPPPKPDDTLAMAMAYQRSTIESLIISRTATSGDLDTAVQLAGQLDAVPPLQLGPVYSWLLEAMVRKGNTQRALEAVRQCVQQDGSFPYDGAIALIGAGRLDTSATASVAREGIAIAEAETGAVHIRQGANFLQELHAQTHAFDGRIEDAVEAMLRAVSPLSAGNSGDRLGVAETESLLLSLVAQIAPDREADLRAAYPAGSIPPLPPMQVESDATGRVSTTFAPDAIGKLAQGAAANPAATLAAAGAMQGDDQRFRALAAIAAALVDSSPRAAAEAADSALELLKGHKALLDGYAIVAAGLAQTFTRLHQRDAATDLIGRCLDRADNLAAQFDHQFADLAEQQGWLGAMTIVSIPIVGVYEKAVEVAPAMTLLRARNSRSRFLKPELLAVVAAGMATQEQDNR